MKRHVVARWAEGVAWRLLPSRITVTGAGSAQACVNRRTVRALFEVDVDILGHISRSAVLIPPDSVDTVITLCAGVACPVWAGQGRRLAWPRPDSAVTAGDEDARFAAFRAARDALTQRISALANHRAG